MWRESNSEGERGEGDTRRGRGDERETETKTQTERGQEADFIWFLDPATPEVHLGILMIKLVNAFLYLSQLEMCFSH